MIGILQYCEIIWIELWDVKIEFFQWDHEQNGGETILKTAKVFAKLSFLGSSFA